MFLFSHIANNNNFRLIFCREGKGEASRVRLVDRLQQYIPPNIMLPPRRLKSLLKQAVEMQADRCSCHDVAWITDLENVSLLVDHDCGIDTVSTCCITNTFYNSQPIACLN